MPERIAIKVLTVSDLTFFDTFFKRSNVGNQKAINLNADVFAKQLYPDYSERAVGRDVEDAVSVVIYGPRPGKPYKVARSITKKTAYKNWRLNGAAVPDPDDEAGRFDHLAVGDVAAIEFLGDAAPEGLRIVIVSSSDDPVLHNTLKNTPPANKSMVAITRARLSQLASDADVPADHPIRALLDDPELEEILELAHLGSEPAVRRLKERTGKRLTKSDLQSARDRAERVGDDGEALANHLLQDMAAAGKLNKVIWTAKDDAAASWDFETLPPSPTRFDAKSTTRQFAAPFHLSGAETVAASSAETPYRIVRVFDLTEDGANAAISEPINDLARAILAGIQDLPAGVLPIGFTIDPKALKWSGHVWVERPEEPDLTPPQP